MGTRPRWMHSQQMESAAIARAFSISAARGGGGGGGGGGGVKTSHPQSTYLKCTLPSDCTFKTHPGFHQITPLKHTPPSDYTFGGMLDLGCKFNQGLGTSGYKEELLICAGLHERKCLDQEGGDGLRPALVLREEEVGSVNQGGMELM